MRYGRLVRHERVLDLRDGVLRREVEWISPAGQGVRIRSTRLVSFDQRSVAAICYEVEPLEAAARIVVQSSSSPTSPCLASPTTRGRRPRCAPRSSASTTGPTSCAPRWSTAPSRASCGWRRGWTTSSTVRTTSTRRPRASPTSRASRSARSWRPGNHCASSSCSPTAGRASARCRRCATRPRARSRPRAGRAGTACVRRSGRTSTTSGTGRTSSSTATSRSSRPFASRSSTCCRPARGRSTGRSRPRASPAAATTGTPSGTWRRTRSRC